MSKPLIMTPGPTSIHHSVRHAMAQPIIQPDLDPAFYDLYKETTSMLAQIINTENEVLILNGEGILGLEAACASLIEPGDRVLVISNGIFGEGFGDFVEMYGGIPIYYRSDKRQPLNPFDLDQFLKKNHDFDLATIVHCETPSGFINPIETICPILDKYNIISIVDAVSSIGGIPVETDAWHVDIMIGASQKCLSAPPGLTFLSLSQRAKKKMTDRKSPIRSFYANLSIWDNWYEKRWFPYTQPVSDIFALHKATTLLLEDEQVYIRHRRIANIFRNEAKSMGFELFPLSGCSDTVTTLMVPDDLDDTLFIQTLLKDHNILISGGFDFLEGKVLRIGHMGNNCYLDNINKTLDAMKAVLKKILV